MSVIKKLFVTLPKTGTWCMTIVNTIHSLYDNFAVFGKLPVIQGFIVIKLTLNIFTTIIPRKC